MIVRGNLKNAAMKPWPKDVASTVLYVSDVALNYQINIIEDMMPGIIACFA